MEEVVEERDNLTTGPLSLLYEGVKTNSQVLIRLRNNHNLLSRVKAFDRHCNMVLEDVTEIWSEKPSGKASEAIQKSRRVGKMFLRGDSVVMVVKNINNI